MTQEQTNEVQDTATEDAAPQNQEVDRDKVINDYLTGLTVDDMRKIPAFNQHTQRVLSDYDKRRQREQRETSEKQTRLAQTESYFRQLSEDPYKFQQAMQDPTMASAYNELMDARSGANTQKQQWATETVMSLVDELKKDEDYSDADVDELLSSKNPVEAILKLAKHGGNKLSKKEVAKLNKDVEARIKSEVEATLAARLADDNTRAPRPNTPNASTAPSGSVKFTPESIEAMDTPTWNANKEAVFEYLRQEANRNK